MTASATDPARTSPVRGLSAKRQAIMETALAVFVRQGYAATSLEDIAAATPVSRQTVYNHFGDKESLFLAVVDRELTATLDALRAATSGFPGPPVDAEDYLLSLARRVTQTFLSPRTGGSAADRGPDPRRRSVRPLVTGTVWQMTELGTFGTSDPTTVDPEELDAAVRANVGLFVRGYPPAA